jgi:hypothetical protein
MLADAPGACVCVCVVHVVMCVCVCFHGRLACPLTGAIVTCDSGTGMAQRGQSV